MQFLVYVVTPLATTLRQLVPHAVYTLHVLVLASNVKVKQSGRSKQLRKHSPVWFAMKVLLTDTLPSILKPTNSSKVNRRHSENKQNRRIIQNTNNALFIQQT